MFYTICCPSKLYVRWLSLDLSLDLNISLITLGVHLKPSCLILFRKNQTSDLKMAVAISLSSSSATTPVLLILLSVMALFAVTVCFVFKITFSVCFANWIASHSKKVCFSVSCMFCLQVWHVILMFLFILVLREIGIVLNVSL